MGKESIPAQFLKAIFIPEEKYGLEAPKEPTVHKPFPHAGKKRSRQQLHD